MIWFIGITLDIIIFCMHERIDRMNRRLENEIGEPIITKYEGKWRLIKKLRRDFAAASQHAESGDATNVAKL